MDFYVERYGVRERLASNSEPSKEERFFTSQSGVGDTLDIAGSFWYQMVVSELMEVVRTGDLSSYSTLLNSIQSVISSQVANELNPPSPPRNLELQARVQGFVAIWDPSLSPSVDGYRLRWRQRQPGGLWSSFRTAPYNFEADLVFDLDVPTRPNAEVEISVEAFRQFEDNYPRVYSTSITITGVVRPGQVSDEIPPGPVEGLKAEPLLGGDVRLSWRNPPDSDLSTILIETVTTGSTREIPANPGINVSLDLVINGNRYFQFNVTAVDTSRNRSLPESVTVRLDNEAPLSPLIVVSESKQLSNSTIRVVWKGSPSTGLDESVSYNAWLTDNLNGNQVISVPFDTDIDGTADSGRIVIGDTTYYFAIFAVPQGLANFERMFNVSALDVLGNESDAVSYLLTAIDTVVPSPPSNVLATYMGHISESLLAFDRTYSDLERRSFRIKWTLSPSVDVVNYMIRVRDTVSIARVGDSNFGSFSAAFDLSDQSVAIDGGVTSISNGILATTGLLNSQFLRSNGNDSLGDFCDFIFPASTSDTVIFISSGERASQETVGNDNELQYTFEVIVLDQFSNPTDADTYGSLLSNSVRPDYTVPSFIASSNLLVYPEVSESKLPNGIYLEVLAGHNFESKAGIIGTFAITNNSSDISDSVADITAVTFSQAATGRIVQTSFASVPQPYISTTIVPQLVFQLQVVDKYGNITAVTTIPGSGSILISGSNDGTGFSSPNGESIWLPVDDSGYSPSFSGGNVSPDVNWTITLPADRDLWQVDTYVLIDSATPLPAHGVWNINNGIDVEPETTPVLSFPFNSYAILDILNIFRFGIRLRDVWGNYTEPQTATFTHDMEAADLASATFVVELGHSGFRIGWSTTLPSDIISLKIGLTTDGSFPSTNGIPVRVRVPIDTYVDTGYDGTSTIRITGYDLHIAGSVVDSDYTITVQGIDRSNNISTYSIANTDGTVVFNLDRQAPPPLVDLELSNRDTASVIFTLTYDVQPSADLAAGVRPNIYRLSSRNDETGTFIAYSSSITNYIRELNPASTSYSYGLGLENLVWYRLEYRTYDAPWDAIALGNGINYRNYSAPTSIVFFLSINPDPPRDLSIAPYYSALRVSWNAPINWNDDANDVEVTEREYIMDWFGISSRDTKRLFTTRIQRTYSFTFTLSVADLIVDSIIYPTSTFASAGYDFFASTPIGGLVLPGSSLAGVELTLPNDYSGKVALPAEFFVDQTLTDAQRQITQLMVDEHPSVVNDREEGDDSIFFQFGRNALDLDSLVDYTFELQRISISTGERTLVVRAPFSALEASTVYHDADRYSDEPNPADALVGLYRVLLSSLPEEDRFSVFYQEVWQQIGFFVPANVQFYVNSWRFYVYPTEDRQLALSNRFVGTLSSQHEYWPGYLFADDRPSRNLGISVSGGNLILKADSSWNNQSGFYSDLRLLVHRTTPTGSALTPAVDPIIIDISTPLSMSDYANGLLAFALSDEQLSFLSDRTRNNYRITLYSIDGTFSDPRDPHSITLRSRNYYDLESSFVLTNAASRIVTNPLPPIGLSVDVVDNIFSDSVYDLDITWDTYDSTDWNRVILSGEEDGRQIEGIALHLRNVYAFANSTKTIYSVNARDGVYTPLSVLASTYGLAFTRPATVFERNSTLYAIDNVTTSLWTLDADTGEATFQAVLTGFGGNSDATVASVCLELTDSKDVYVYMEDGILYRLNVVDGVLTFLNDTGVLNIRSMVAFNDVVYGITQDGEIYIRSDNNTFASYATVSGVSNVWTIFYSGTVVCILDLTGRIYNISTYFDSEVVSEATLLTTLGSPIVGDITTYGSTSFAIDTDTLVGTVDILSAATTVVFSGTETPLGEVTTMYVDSNNKLVLVDANNQWIVDENLWTLTKSSVIPTFDFISQGVFATTNSGSLQFGSLQLNRASGVVTLVASTSVVAVSGNDSIVAVTYASSYYDIYPGGTSWHNPYGLILGITAGGAIYYADSSNTWTLIDDLVGHTDINSIYEDEGALYFMSNNALHHITNILVDDVMSELLFTFPTADVIPIPVIQHNVFVDETIATYHRIPNVARTNTHGVLVRADNGSSDLTRRYSDYVYYTLDDNIIPIGPTGRPSVTDITLTATQSVITLNVNGITWEDSSETDRVVYYRYRYRGTGNRGWTVPVHLPIDSGAYSVIISDLEFGEEFDVGVIVVNSNGHRSTWYFETISTIFGIPGTISPTFTADFNSITVTWDAFLSDDEWKSRLNFAERKYRLQYQQGSTTSSVVEIPAFDPITSAPLSTYTFTGFQSSTDYSIKLTAYNGANEGPGEYESVTTLARPEARVPEDLTVTFNSRTSSDPGSALTVNFSWTVEFIPDNFRIQVKQSSSSIWNAAIIRNGDITSTVIDSLITGTSYDFRIRSENTGGVSLWAYFYNYSYPDSGTLSSTPRITSISFSDPSDSTKQNVVLPRSTPFSSSIFSYNANTSYQAMSTSVTVVPSDPSIAYTITPTDGITATGHQVPLSSSSGNTVVIVSAISQDGTTQDYVFTISKPSTASTDATLYAFLVTDVPFTFSPITESYDTVLVTNSINKVSVTAIPNHFTATVSILPLDDDVVSSGHQVDLEVGINAILARVTAESGDTRDYTISVDRQSADSSLRFLTFTGIGSNSFAFVPGVFSYPNITAPNSSIITMVSITPNDSDAVVTVNGSLYVDGIEISLVVSTNDIEIIVVSEDGSTTTTYSVTITRAYSSNTGLSSIVANFVSRITIPPTVLVPQTLTAFPASVEVVNDALEVFFTNINAAHSESDSSIVETPEANGRFLLDVGDNIFTVQIVSENGTTIGNHIITVDRLPSSNARLSNLYITDLDGNVLALAEAFIPTTYDYTVSVPYMESVLFGWNRQDDTSTVDSPSGSENDETDFSFLITSALTTVFSLVITAEDNTTRLTYTVTVTRPSSPVTELDSLTLILPNGTIVPSRGILNASHRFTSLGTDGTASITDPYGLWSDGTTLWMSSYSGNGSLYSYGLTSHTRTGKIDTLDAAGNWNPRGIWSNGRIIWVVDSGHLKIFAYTLSSGVREVDREFNLHSSNSNPTGIWSDGITLWIADSDALRIFAYNLYNRVIDTSTSTKEFVLDPENDNSSGIWSDGITMYVSDSADNKIYAYNMDTKVREQFNDMNLDSINTSARGIWSDGQLLWVVDDSGDEIYAYDFIGNVIDPVFDTSTLTYNATTNYAIDYLSIQATPVLPGTLSIGGSTIPDIGYRVDLVSNTTNSVIVLVTSEDGDNEATYTINIFRTPNDVSSLSGLALSSGTLSPNFADRTYSYTASVPNTVDIVSILPTLADSNASFRITPIDSDPAENHQVDLSVGSNSIIIRVIAENGYDVFIYGIVITRLRSSDTTLLSLTLVTPGLDIDDIPITLTPGTLNYSVPVDNSIDSVTVIAIANHSEALVTSITTGGTVITVPLSLSVGSTVVIISLRAEDGTTGTYTITIRRSLSSDSSLFTLTASVGNRQLVLDPPFTSTIYSYSISINYDDERVSFVYLLGNSDSGIVANVTDVDDTTSGLQIDVAYDSIIPIILTVTSEDGFNTSAYNISITRPRSNIDTLSTLELTDVTLSPDFSSTVTTYTGTKSSIGLSESTLTAALDDSRASLVITPNDIDGTTSNHQLAINNNGIIVVTITVTAHNGTDSEVYTVNILRTSSSNNGLSSASFSNDSLFVPTFNRNVHNYVVTFPHRHYLTDLTLVLSDSLSSSVVTGSYRSIFSETLTVGNFAGSIGFSSGSYGSMSARVIPAELLIGNATSSILELKSTADSDGLVITLPTGVTWETDLSDYRLLIADSNNDIVSNLSLSDMTRSTDGRTLSYATQSSGSYLSAFAFYNTGNILSVHIFDNNGSAFILDSSSVTATVAVTAEDGSIGAYEFVLLRGGSPESSLRSLTVSTGSLVPPFSSEATTYSITLGPADSSIDISAEPTSRNAAVSISDIPSPLVSGDNEITITVLSEERTYSTEYSIIVIRGSSSNADLRSLSISNGLIEEFDPDQLVYTAEVDNSVTIITVTAAAEDSTAAVRILPTDSGSSSIGHQVDLAEGETKITVTVTSADTINVKEYTISVVRLTSDNSQLDSLIIHIDPELNEPHTTGSRQGVHLDEGTIYVLERGDSVYAFDLFSGDYLVAEDFVLPAAISDVFRGIFMTDTHLYLVDQNADNIYAILRSTKARDTAADITYLISANSTPTGAWTDGTTLWVSDKDDNKIYAYNFNTGTRVPSEDFILTLGSVNKPIGIWSDGITMYVNSDVAPVPRIYAFDMETKEYVSERDIIISEYGIDYGQGLTGDADSGLLFVQGWNRHRQTFDINTRDLWSILWPEFDSSRTQYYSIIGNRHDQYTVKQNLRDASSSVQFRNAFSPITDDDSSTVYFQQDAILGPNTLVARVTSSDADVTNYNVQVYRLPLVLTYLSTLTVVDASSNELVLDPPFNRTIYQYTITVSETDSLSDVTVSAVAAFTSNAVSITPTDSDSTTAGHQVDVSLGDNFIVVEVGTRPNVTPYIIHINWVASSNNNLSEITVNGSSIGNIASDNTEYSYNVPRSTSSVTVVATAEFDTSTVTYSSQQPMNVPNIGEGHELFITVVAQDGTERMYKLTIVRLRSSISTLSDLVVADNNGRDVSFNEEFDPTTISYSSTVDHSATSVVITPTKTNLSSSLTITPTSPVSLIVGVNVITVLVSSEDNTSTSTYTITITRTPSNNANLSDITLSSGTLNPNPFVASISSYTVSIPYAVTSISVDATAVLASEGATVETTAIESGAALNDADDVTAGFQINLAVNSPVAITFAVTAPSGTTDKNYTVTITRQQDTDTTLSSLAVSSGVLTPVFVASTRIYTAEVANAITSVTITATANSPVAQSTVITDSDGTVIVGTVDLVVGASVYTITVISQNGTNETYTLTVTRLPNSDSTLSSLTVSGSDGTGIVLTPVFASDTEIYTLSVSYTIDSIVISYAPTTPVSSVMVIPTDADLDSVGYQVDLDQIDPNVNVIQIIVTPEDPNTLPRTYAVTVTRAKSPDSSLSGLPVYQVLYEADLAIGIDTGVFGFSENLYGELTPTYTRAAQVSYFGFGRFLVSVAGVGEYLPDAPDGRQIRITLEELIQVREIRSDTRFIISYNGNILFDEDLFSASKVESTYLDTYTWNISDAVLSNLHGGVAATLGSTVQLLIIEFPQRLTPTFDSATFDYTAITGYALANRVYIAPVTTQSDSTYVIEPEQPMIVAPNLPSINGTLATVTVTAPDGTVSDPPYTVTVTRPASSNKSLISINMSRNGGPIDDFSVNMSGSIPTGMWSNGTTLWVATSSSVLAFSATDGSADISKNIITIDSENTSIRGIWSDGITLWLADVSKLFAYTLVDRSRNTSRDIDLVSDNRDSSGIWSDGQTIWVLDRTDQIIYAYNLLSGTASPSFNINLSGFGTSELVGIWSNEIVLWIGRTSTNILYAYVRNSNGTHTYNANYDIDASASSGTVSSFWSDGLTVYVISSNGNINLYSIFSNFETETLQYNTRIAPYITRVVVNYEPSDLNSSVDITPEDVDPSNSVYQVSIPTVTAVSLAVTAEDGSTPRTYQVQLSRFGSSDATLSLLDADVGEFTPVFSASVFEYTLSISHDTDSVTITAVANSTTSIVVLTPVNGTTDTSDSAQMSWSASVVVTSQDISVSTYSITVKRLPDDDATLSSMELRYRGIPLTLSPAFDSNTYSYTSIVDEFTEYAFVVFNANDPDVTGVTVTGNSPVIHSTDFVVGTNGTEYGMVVSGNAFGSITTSIIANNTRLFTSDVVHTISRITTSDTTFRFSVFGNILTPNALEGIYIRVSTNDATPIIILEFPIASMTRVLQNQLITLSAAIPSNYLEVYNGESLRFELFEPYTIQLHIGNSSDVIITVTADDGTTIQGYLVDVTRSAQGASNANLSALALSGITLVPAFSTSILDYTASVAHNFARTTATWASRKWKCNGNSII